MRIIRSYLGAFHVVSEYSISYSVNWVILGIKEKISLLGKPSGFTHNNSNTLRNSSPTLLKLISIIAFQAPHFILSKVKSNFRLDVNVLSLAVGV